MVAGKEDRRERRHKEWEWLKIGKEMAVNCRGFLNASFVINSVHDFDDR